MADEVKTPANGDLNLKEKRVILDSASIFVVEENFNLDNFKIENLANKCIGLTQGGADFKAKPKMKEIKFDGAMGRKIKGSERVTAYEVSLDVGALEMLENVFTLSLLDKKTDTAGKYTEYVPIEGIIDNKFYKNILVVGKTTDLKDVIIIVRNVINAEGFNLKTEDEKEGVCKLKLQANYELDKDGTTKTMPFQIRIYN